MVFTLKFYLLTPCNYSLLFPCITPRDVSPGGQIKATIMTAAAMQFNGGPIVSVQINQYDTQEELLVYVDSEVINFTMRGQKWHEYPGTE